MAFVILTPQGKEEILAGILRQRGFRPKFSPYVRGAVVCCRMPPPDIVCSGLVLKIFKTGPGKAGCLHEKLEQKDGKGGKEDTLKSGDMVKVTRGLYRGLSGKARLITGEVVLVNLSLCGRMLTAEVSMREVEKVSPGESMR